MASAQPNAFSNELAQWVGNKCMKSIVFVELRPKDARKVKQWWDSVFPIKGKPEARAAEHDARFGLCRETQCCTGFVMKDVNGHLSILTCAHVLGSAFKQGHPITVEKVNELYDPMILCDHQEQRFQREVVENIYQERVYMTAQVTHIRCSMDLMVLRVLAGEVANCCQDRHPPLRMANFFPKRLEKVVMLSWPVDSDRTAVEGKISHPSRSVSSLDKENRCGYRMRLSEVDIRSENGSSGAPLLNGSGNFLAVLHGGNGKFSFYVSFDNVRAVLTHWGLI